MLFEGISVNGILAAISYLFWNLDAISRCDNPPQLKASLSFPEASFLIIPLPNVVFFSPWSSTPISPDPFAQISAPPLHIAGVSVAFFLLKLSLDLGNNTHLKKRVRFGIAD